MLALLLGFSHWFGPTLGSPDGVSTPVVAIGVEPGVRFLEARARYTVSVTPRAVPGPAEHRVGFASLELVGKHRLSVGSQHMEVLLGPFATLAHAGGVGVGGGLVVGARWTFSRGTEATPALGIFFEGRQVLYRLPGDTGDARRDAQMDLGVVGVL